MKKLFIAFIISFFAISSAFGIDENFHRISLQDAINITVNENPRHQMMKTDVEISKYDIKIANKLENPNIYSTNFMGRAGESNTPELGIEYQIPLFKRMHLKKVAIANKSVAENNYYFNENEIIYQVKAAYFDILHKKSFLTIMNMEKDIAKEILDNAIKENKAGKVSDTDVVLAKIEYNNSIMNCKEAEFEVVSARNKLNSVMNTSPSDYDTMQDHWSKNEYSDLLTPSPLDDSINFEDIKKYTFEHRHDLLSAKAEIKKAEAGLSVIKSQLIPNIGVKAAWIYDRYDFVPSHGAMIGASLNNVPLIYQYKPEIERAKLEIKKAKLAYRDLEIDVTRELTEVWEHYIIAKNNLNFYNKELQANSDELERVSINNLKKNKITMTEFLVTKQRYVELLMNYNDAFTNYFTTYARLLKEIDVKDIELIKNEDL